MVYRVSLGSAAFGMILLSGCNALPPSYDGNFVGTVTGQQVEVDVQSGGITVGVNGVKQTQSDYVTGFDDVMSAIESGRGGVYVLPTVISEEGIPVTTPWLPRYDMSAGLYQNAAQTSDRYQDVFAVFPLNPGSNGGPWNLGDLTPVPVPVLQGELNEFYAFVVYTKIDTQANDAVRSIEVQIAPQADITAANMNIMYASVKMFGIDPGPNSKPVLLSASLSRK